MKNFLLLLLTLLFCLHSSSSAYAKQSREFISHLKDLFYENCSGSELEINKNSEIHFLDESGKEQIFLVPFEKIAPKLEEFLSYLDTQSWNQYSQNGIIRGEDCPCRDGRKILQCSNHWLDIDGNEYFWDGNKIEIPRNNFEKIEVKDSAKATFGSNSPIQELHGNNNQFAASKNGDVNQSSKNLFLELFFTKGTIGGIIISFVLKLIWDFFRKKITPKK